MFPSSKRRLYIPESCIGSAAETAGYYTEYVHPTPGIVGPGPQRIVVGKGGEMYYTADHYKTFMMLADMLRRVVKVIIVMVIIYFHKMQALITLLIKYFMKIKSKQL
ncbi:ribonuclease domain-containing protein [Pseudomonas savastanoi]|uniref:ribonuclease domain-containing protein n=1 Tax=Pseudomonas savastanoi TaxID=29438 RepID=UPI003899AA97|nr:hypothetical protein KP808_14615 [Pseudomonas savastanoi]